MGKRIEKTFVIAIVLLYQILSFSSASAGLFDWLEGSKYSDATMLEKSVLFQEVNNWGKQSSSSSDQKVQEIKVVKTYTVRATGYSSTPDQTDDTPFITASGSTVRDGIVAANFLPFGTKVRIPDVYGDKVFVVEDRMNRRYWMNIDIWFPERGLALQFGSQNVLIEIVEES